MTAEKGNKVYTIDVSMEAQYQNDGFDIKDDSGEIIAYGKGRTVPYADYMKAVREIGELRENLAGRDAETEPLRSGRPPQGAGRKPPQKKEGE